MAMQCWVAGNLEWSFGTHRYFGFDNEKIRKSLLVELAPAKVFVAKDGPCPRMTYRSRTGCLTLIINQKNLQLPLERAHGDLTRSSTSCMYETGHKVIDNGLL